MPEGPDFLIYIYIYTYNIIYIYILYHGGEVI